ncbi:MAG: hypothetical protein H0T99_00730 [Geodermatophilaceae bacterium]|nr:hypothetical protein [Geodermatophilaceae bacterium]MDQ3475183.1 hypothetical protein [Actinomycetota bacterium]
MDISEELAIEYAVVRREFLRATQDQIVERMLDRLDEAQQLELASEALTWSEQPGSRRDLARLAVRNFVEAWEGDPDAS